MHKLAHQNVDGFLWERFEEYLVQQLRWSHCLSSKEGQKLGCINIEPKSLMWNDKVEDFCNISCIIFNKVTVTATRLPSTEEIKQNDCIATNTPKNQRACSRVLSSRSVPFVGSLLENFVQFTAHDGTYMPSSNVILNKPSKHEESDKADLSIKEKRM